MLPVLFGIKIITAYNIEYSADIEKDLVLSQDIKGGSMVAKNSTIKVVLSGGVEQITMRPHTRLQCYSQ